MVKEKQHIWNITSKIADELEFKKGDVTAVIKAFSREIIREVYAGNTVAITHFGTFVPYPSSGRKARNPITGDAVKVPPRIMIKFRPYWKWKDSLKQAKFAAELEVVPAKK